LDGILVGALVVDLIKKFRLWQYGNVFTQWLNSQAMTNTHCAQGPKA
jgi:hypothetical protein